MKRFAAFWALMWLPLAATAQEPERGSGIATSMFGTYIQRGELILYPFYEHYHDGNAEYKPEEFGFPGSQDFRGRYRANEALFFLAYGVGENVAVEFETAAIRAAFEKSPLDSSAMPRRIAEGGLGDVEGQIRWRWKRERGNRPELFSYGEAVIPHAKDKLLIGTPDWEFKFGTGAVRGFTWGTVTVRAAIEYSRASSSPWDIGEYAVEYLKRLSPKWRVYAGVEGTQDELSLIAEAQLQISRRAFIRLNNGFGLTSKATDWAPELGIVFTLP
jgi:hypothetical protein